MDIERITFGPKFLAAMGNTIKEKSVELFSISVLITEMGPGFLFRGDHNMEETIDRIMGAGWYRGIVNEFSDAMSENRRDQEVMMKFAEELDEGIKRMEKRGKEGEEG